MIHKQYNEIMSNSKKKGSRFELKVSKWFTEWTSFKFGRTPYSGANHQSRDLSSDIMCQDERHAHRCKISVECKNYKDIKFEHVLLGNKSCDILKFWEQASKDAKRAKKVPILCMRYNSMPSSEFFFVVGVKLGDIIAQYVTKVMYIQVPGNTLMVFMASEILKVPYMKKRIPYSYVIFYLERKYYHLIEKELKEKGYENIKVIIPTLDILKRTVKGKMVFESVPILFNYGFMRMPTENAFSRPFLNKLKRNISGIRTFLKSTETMHERKKKVRIDNAEDFDDFSLVATCSRKDVRRFIRLAKANKKYSVDDLMNVKLGDYIVLKGYPYEGIDATVLDVNYSNRTVKVLIYPEHGKMEVTLDFDSVLYSVYQDSDPDKLHCNNFDYDPNSITSEKIEENINKRRR